LQINSLGSHNYIYFSTTILYMPETSEKHPNKPIIILHVMLCTLAIIDGENTANKIIINPIITNIMLDLFMLSSP